MHRRRRVLPLSRAKTGDRGLTTTPKDISHGKTRKILLFQCVPCFSVAGLRFAHHPVCTIALLETQGGQFFAERNKGHGSWRSGIWITGGNCAKPC